MPQRQFFIINCISFWKLLQSRHIRSLIRKFCLLLKNSSKLFYIKTHITDIVIYKLVYSLRILYTQLIRITLTTHVLPRLLAHVLAMASCKGYYQFFFPNVQVLQLVVLITYVNSLGHACAHCPKFSTAAKGRVFFIPYVADSSLKSTRDHRLSSRNFC